MIPVARLVAELSLIIVLFSLGLLVYESGSVSPKKQEVFAYCGVISSAYSKATIAAGATREVLLGEKLIQMNCTPCHDLGDRKVIGEGFVGMASRIPSEEWFVQLLKDPKGMVEKEDPYWVSKIGGLNESLQQHPFFYLYDTEIAAIVAYVKAIE